MAGDLQEVLRIRGGLGVAQLPPLLAGSKLKERLKKRVAGRSWVDAQGPS